MSINFMVERRFFVAWNLEIEPVRSPCIMGRNGVGKTTLLKAIMGLLPQSKAARSP